MAYRHMQEVAHEPIGTSEDRLAQSVAWRAARQAFWLLRVGFTAAPILAGLDKFFHVLVDWDKYLAPSVNGLLGGHGHAFMLAAGVIEIVAGIGIALRPRIFAYVVAGWLVGIIVNLLLIPGFYDVALRDLGLAIGALALGRLSLAFDGVRTARERSGPQG